MNDSYILEPPEFDTEHNRIKKMCFRFLAEIPMQYIMAHVERLGGKVTLSPETQHCAGCVGYLHQDDPDADQAPCPGVEP